MHIIANVFSGITSNHESASLRDAILPNINALVLLTKCVSIVSFKEPVL